MEEGRRGEERRGGTVQLKNTCSGMEKTTFLIKFYIKVNISYV
jgi:hypothetical protein